MKTVAIAIVIAFACVIDGFAPVNSLAQERVRIGVPLFPTVSYPVLIAQEKGFFERNGLKAEIIRINSEPTTYQALISGGIDAAPVDFVFEPKMKQLGFHLVPSKKTPFMNGPITVTVAQLKANRGKWLKFVKAYLEATHYLTTNRDGSMDVLKKIIQTDERETLDHGYEQMRARATVDLVAPEPAIENLVRMMTYIDKRAASVDRNKLVDYSILKELAATRRIPVKQ